MRSLYVKHFFVFRDHNKKHLEEISFWNITVNPLIRLILLLHTICAYSQWTTTNFPWFFFVRSPQARSVKLEFFSIFFSSKFFTWEGEKTAFLSSSLQPQQLMHFSNFRYPISQATCYPFWITNKNKAITCSLNVEL